MPVLWLKKNSQAIAQRRRGDQSKTVQRHMREMGIVAIYPGPNLSRKQHKAHIFPYLLRNLTVYAPNHAHGHQFLIRKFFPTRLYPEDWATVSSCGRAIKSGEAHKRVQ